MHLLPSIDNTFNMIIQEERHSFIVRDQDTRTEVVTLVARVKDDNNGLTCTICHKSGHDS